MELHWHWTRREHGGDCSADERPATCSCPDVSKYVQWDVRRLRFVDTDADPLQLMSLQCSWTSSLPTYLRQPDLSYSRFRHSLKLDFVSTVRPKSYLNPFNCTLAMLLLIYFMFTALKYAVLHKYNSLLQNIWPACSTNFRKIHLWGFYAKCKMHGQWGLFSWITNVIQRTMIVVDVDYPVLR